MHPRIDPSTRLRRAIHLNDLILVRRILKNNPHILRNPDYEDGSSTSLHLAANLGHVEITVGIYPCQAYHSYDLRASITAVE